MDGPIPFERTTEQTVVDLGKGPPLFWVKTEEILKEEKLAGQVKQPLPTPLAQSLNLALKQSLKSYDGKQSYKLRAAALLV